MFKLSHQHSLGDGPERLLVHQFSQVLLLLVFRSGGGGQSLALSHRLHLGLLLGGRLAKPGTNFIKIVVITTVHNSFTKL